MDGSAWSTQRTPQTKVQRSGALWWQAGGERFVGDPLGPVLHAHDGAAEVFYFPRGRCRFQIGRTEREFGPGTFVYLPPDVPHNLLNAGPGELWCFIIVGPNLFANRWRTEGFAPSGWDIEPVVVNIREPGADLPSDGRIRSKLGRLAPGEEQSPHVHDDCEKIYYVVEGAGEVVVGHLTGTLGPDQFVHIPMGLEHGLRNVGGGELVYMSFMTPNPRSKG